MLFSTSGAIPLNFDVDSSSPNVVFIEILSVSRIFMLMECLSLFVILFSFGKLKPMCFNENHLNL